MGEPDRPPGPPPRWTGWVLGFGVLTLGFRVINNVRTIDLDLFHEMALIREALALGGIPREDTFSYTSTVSPVVHHEWGTGAILYSVVVGLGLGEWGLVLLRLVLLAGVVACCVAVARARGAGATAMALMAPLAIVLFWPGLSPVRAHMFTFLLLALLLFILEQERRGDRRWLLLWPPLFVLWLNLHGGFVVGVGLLGLYALERSLRAAWPRARDGGNPLGKPSARGRLEAIRTGAGHLWLAVGVTAPLLLVNPYGAAYIPYIWHALALDRPYMTEWFPLWSETFRGAPLLLFLASLSVAAYTLLRGNAWKRLPGLLMVLAAAFFALRSARILPIYSLVWFAYVAPALSATPLVPVVRGIWHRHARPLAAAVLVMSVVGMGRMIHEGSFSVFLPTEPGDYRQLFPAGAVDYLAEVGFQGNLMTPFGVGAYVSWRLHPQVRVGMDSRYEVAYSPELAEETMRIYNGEGDWRSFLDRFPTDAVLVPHEGRLDSLMVAGAPGPPDAGPMEEEGARQAVPLQEGTPWIEVFRDDGYAVFASPAVAEGLPRVDRRGEPIIGRFP